MVDISFTVLVHNEGELLEKLLNQIVTVASNNYEYEVILVDDFSTDQETIDIIKKYEVIDNIHVFQRKLDMDFASQKNFANSKCKGQYIVNVDADEVFSTALIENLDGVMVNNSEVDMIWVPRINIVNGLRQEHITKWGWKVNERGWVNFPDYQARIYKNSPDIKWKNKVHEVITGAKVIGRLPAEEDWCLIHVKPIERQVEQNAFYDTINFGDTHVPINYEYFMGMELATGGGGKEIVNQNGTLKTVEDVVNFWSDKKNHEKIVEELNPKNWQYYNAMMAEFRKNVADHHELGWENMTAEYYSSLDEMTDEELEVFLKENPVGFENGMIKHGYHRACAMIGRLVSGKKYIPFYMTRQNVYDVPFKDGVTRIHNPIKFVKKLSELDVMGIPRSEYTICQSGILSVMGIRQNDDLDIIISDKLRTALGKGDGHFVLGTGIEVFPKNYDKFKQFGCTTDDEAISNYSGNISGFNFLEPRFYFSRKHKDKTERDISDWKKINKFFEDESEKGYPFNVFTAEQWYKK